MKPLLLDLFCGAGGAAMGYHRAGFEVVGVDINPQPNYPFIHHRWNALEFLGEMLAEREDDSPFGLFKNATRGLAAIHASPPCQWQTAYARRPGHVAPSPNLISEVRKILRKMCVPYGIPYVIESPESSAARAELVNPTRFCGSSFGLDVRRHRLFESNIAITAPPCYHARQTPRFPPATNRKNLRSTVEIGVWRIPLDVQWRAMGIDWMDRKELSQAIPPAYTEHIGKQLMAYIRQTMSDVSKRQSA